MSEQQQAALRELSAATGRSISDLVRDGIDRVLAAQLRPNRAQLVERAIQVTGRFSSGSTTGSEKHDDHLSEAYR